MLLFSQFSSCVIAPGTGPPLATITLGYYTAWLCLCLSLLMHERRPEVLERSCRHSLRERGHIKRDCSLMATCDYTAISPRLLMLAMHSSVAGMAAAVMRRRRYRVSSSNRPRPGHPVTLADCHRPAVTRRSLMAAATGPRTMRGRMRRPLWPVTSGFGVLLLAESHGRADVHRRRTRGVGGARSEGYDPPRADTSNSALCCSSSRSAGQPPVEF
jgi:hypothetical protein